MFYFYRAKAQQPAQPKDKALPKFGKLFIIFFILFHVVFISFNIYYFMFQSEAEGVDVEMPDSIEAIDSINEISIEALRNIPFPFLILSSKLLLSSPPDNAKTGQN